MSRSVKIAYLTQDELDTVVQAMYDLACGQVHSDHVAIERIARDLTDADRIEIAERLTG